MFTFLLVVHALIAAALVGVILMQRSEGGGLGMGGGPAGLMTARGAADFLSRATAVLATLFVLMAFLMAALASMRGGTSKIDTSLAKQPDAAPITAPIAPATPTSGIPMMGGSTIGGIPAAGPDAATSQAIAPASGGLPPATAKPVEEQKAKRPAVTADSLKTIDTKSAGAGSSIGINGVGSSTKPAAAKSAPAEKTEKKPAPANDKPAVDKSASKTPAVIDIPAPAAPASSGTGNQQ